MIDMFDMHTHFIPLRWKPIKQVEDEKEAIQIANDSLYGLSGSIFTEDRHHGVEVAMKIETGMIHVNDQSVNDEAHVPFGGEKASGIGRFNGEWAIDKFTTVKWIGFRILGLKPLLENKGLYMKQF